ncbi:NAD(P)-binding protein [Pyrenochaeta sp. DS3sAY3a]|nr:NAD(P)-binding protein [Pyrenochaeta sp. DS3sAY3a]
MSTPPATIASSLPSDLSRRPPHPYTPSTAIPSLAGKVFLITGASAGIGKQTALELAVHGKPAQIWIAARNAEAGEKAVEEIKGRAPGVDVRFLEVDLASLESVRAAAGRVVKEAERMDCVVLNAGIMGGSPGTTLDGYEKQFGTNHVGHALLLRLLTPLLLKTAAAHPNSPPRVISLSSAGHRSVLPDGGIAFDSLKSAQLHLSGVLKYTQSKLANVVYARQYAAHYPQLISVAIHPGEVGTELFNKGAQGGGPEIEYLAREIAPKMGVSVEEGAKNSLWAATAKEVQTGRYYEPVGEAGLGSELSKDEAFGKNLWEWTERELDACLE